MSKYNEPNHDLDDWVNALENLVLFDGKDSAKEVVKGLFLMQKIRSS